MSRIKTVYFFANGNTLVFDQLGQQIPQVQESWLLKYLEWLNLQPEMIGTTLEDLEIIIPGGTAKVFKTSQGYNWKIS